MRVAPYQLENIGRQHGRKIMDGIWIAMAGFMGATFGSVITGYLIEFYRQRNRLQLAAVDKRLEVYQEGYRRVLEIALFILGSIKQNMRPDDSKLQTMRSDALGWLQGHYLYLM